MLSKNIDYSTIVYKGFLGGVPQGLVLGPTLLNNHNNIAIHSCINYVPNIRSVSCNSINNIFHFHANQS